MSRKIVIPWKINERLERLAQLQQETNGVLLYVPEKRPFGFNYNVRALYMTGVGTAHNVQADPRRMEIVNIFFEKGFISSALRLIPSKSAGRELLKYGLMIEDCKEILEKG